LDENESMVTAPPSQFSPELLEEFEQAVARAMSGKRDPEAMKRAHARMDAIREEIRRVHGELNIAVPAIRELRDNDDLGS
jgi:hypothetical protein